MRRVCFQFTAFFLLAMALASASDAPPPPELPIRPPSPGAWQTEETRPGLESPLQALWESHGGRFRVRYYLEERLVTEIWLLDDEHAIIRSQTGRILRDPIDEYSPYARMSGSKFPAMTWLAPEHYQGVVSYDGGEAYHFRTTRRLGNTDGDDDLLEGESGMPARGPEELEAWIDTATLLPIADVQGRTRRTYTFRSPPERLDLPSDIVEVLERRQRREEELRARHSMP